MQQDSNLHITYPPNEKILIKHSRKLFSKHSLIAVRPNIFLKIKYMAIGTNTAFAIYMWKHIIKITNQEANKNASKQEVE